MSNFKYFPLIKTRDAELRCFEKLSDDSLAALLPIYELTKSRKTQKTPDGDIYRRMKKIKEIQGDKPFILDLSTDPRYTNPQIQQLLSEHKSFYEWQVFIFELHPDLNIVPMIHLYEDDDGVTSDVEGFVRDASARKPNLAVRIPYDLDEIDEYLSPIRNNLNDQCTLFVILDAEHIRETAEFDLESIATTFSETAQAVADCLEHKLEDVVMLCSSFPSSPVAEASKNPATRATADFEGEFPIYEEPIYQKIRESYPIKYGDYASINTEQIEIRGGTFVPRIDIALTVEDKFIYKRYRRDDGTYERCAQEILADHRYVNMGGWADNEILLASNDDATGISPAFWISVRMEYYINTRLQLRSNIEV